MKKPARYLVTAALPYANGPKHIGHLAGAYIPADIYARYLRLCQQDVLFVCGSDEHGTAIPNQALKESTTPKAIIDKYDQLIKDCFKKLDISFDIYHRTSDPVHHETAQEIFLQLHEKGLLKEEVSEQYYDEETSTYLADRYIVGTCPRCSHDNAYGDQCEKCGSTLSPRELINPRSTLSGKSPVLRPTKHWYLPLAESEAWLRKWILEGHGHDWKTNVLGQCKSWLDAGLQSRAMTRDLDWGIQVPLPDAEGKVLYVWFDAPIGYISATRAFFKELAANETQYATPRRAFPNPKADDWKKYWHDDATSLVHFVGKDNIVFHCIIFPAMLHATGQYVVPSNVPANEFMNLEGDKMSTSRGWSIEMHDYLADFPDKPDVLRYALLTNLPETKDSEFTWKDFQAKNNNELVAIFGNFVNRALVLTKKHFDHKVPKAVFTPADTHFLEELKSFPKRIGDAISAYKMREATALLIDLARSGNKYLADNEPWKLLSDKERMGTILHVALQTCASLAILAEPFLPFTATRLKQMLQLDNHRWEAAGECLLTGGHALGEVSLLFEKIEDMVVEKQLEKLQRAAKVDTVVTLPEAKSEISFDQFTASDIRIGQVITAEKVAKSKKLLKLDVDTGLDKRVIVSGIAAHYTPEDLVGKQVVVLVNLAPRKIMGIQSEGMLLMASTPEGELVLIGPEKNISPGSMIS